MFGEGSECVGEGEGVEGGCWEGEGWASPDPKPRGERHDAVVNHVEGGQVAELLPEEEQQGVEVVNEFGEEIPPGHVQGVHGILGV